MLPYLDLKTPFPNIEFALPEPNGLLAAGADLSVERLLSAYRHGIFPWYSAGEPILWWSPDPRTVFEIGQFRPSRSLKRFIRKQPLTITFNHAFEQVVEGCAEPRAKEKETWITPEMKAAYCNLHLAGYAHSVEVWLDKRLIGGIYGVESGLVFCGESMFSRVSNGSKVALTALIAILRQNNFLLLDCQIENSHLMSLGATNICREQYLNILKNGQNPDYSSILSGTCEIKSTEVLSAYSNGN